MSLERQLENSESSVMADTVLIVDDDRYVLTLLERHLSAAGFRVLKAAGGLEGLQIMRQEGPALVVVDWEMPHMDGIEFCKAIRSAEWAGPTYIVILTGLTNEDRMVEALEAGADKLLSKPIRPADFVARLQAGQRMLALQIEAQVSSPEPRRRGRGGDEDLIDPIVLIPPG